MKNLKAVQLFFGALFALWASTLQAATISLTPADQTVEAGSQLSLDLYMDFTDDPTLGGGVDIFYNGSFFDFVSFTFNSALGDTPSSRRQPDDLTNELNGLAFGNDTGLAGPALVGTLVFNVLGPEETLSFTMADNDSPAGKFFSANTSTAQTVGYQGASVTIVNAVPIPATAWLLASGLGLFGFAGCRRSAA